MNGSCSFMGKLMGICINVDKMMGDDFAAGLANLKALVESK